MFAELFGLIVLAGQQITIPLGHPPQVEQPRAPIEESGPAWVKACAGSDDWTKPAPPVRIHGNSYLVGTCGISSILIVGTAGDVMIDAGPAEAPPLIAANIRQLGFRIRDVRFLLTSHEHHDHVGGLAALQRMTGATVVSSAPTARELAAGTVAASDPQAGLDKPFDPVSTGRVIRDGDQVRLGNIMLTAMTTPGHTAGATSWRWVSCDGGVCRTIVYADSLSPVSRDGYRFTDHPDVIANFRASIAKIAASDCDILLTPHPSSSDLPARLGRGKPLLDEGGCRAYAAKLTVNLDQRLAKERDR